MSAAERMAYSGASPILSDEVARSAELVRQRLDVGVRVPDVVVRGARGDEGLAGAGAGARRGLRARPPHAEGAPGHARPRAPHRGVTTYGSPPLAAHLAGDGGHRTLARTLRLSAHPLARTTWLGLYRMDTATDADRAAFLARVEQRLAQPVKVLVVLRPPRGVAASPPRCATGPSPRWCVAGTRSTCSTSTPRASTRCCRGRARSYHRQGLAGRPSIADHARPPQGRRGAAAGPPHVVGRAAGHREGLARPGVGRGGGLHLVPGSHPPARPVCATSAG